MFIDLNGFKKVNDNHGHGAGDEALKTIAVRLKASTRNDDTVSRHGGDEFLYLLTEAGSEPELAGIADKLAASIEVPFGVVVDGVHLDLSLSASIGIAIYPKDGATGPALVNSADKAMYRAKKSSLRHAFVP